MNRLLVSARGICSWRERLANPDRQWKRRYSAMETAISWESAKGGPGFPDPIAQLFRDSGLGKPYLMFAVAEHKVDLPGSAPMMI